MPPKWYQPPWRGRRPYAKARAAPPWAQQSKQPAISKGERRRRARQAAQDKLKSLTAAMSQMSLPKAGGSTRSRKRAGGSRANSRPWTLDHDQPTRTDHVIERVVTNLGPARTEPYVDAFAGDYVAYNGFVCVFCPRYSPVNMAVLSTLGTATLDGTDMDASAPLTQRTSTQDPPQYLTNSPSDSTAILRGRAVDGHMTITIKMGASSFATLLVTRLTRALRFMTVSQARAAMLGDLHMVKRFNMKPGSNTVRFPCGIHDTAEYGTWHTGSTPAPTSQDSINQPASGLTSWIFCIEDYAVGTQDFTPRMTITAMSTIQTELSLALNHLKSEHQTIPLSRVVNTMEGKLGEASSTSGAADHLTLANIHSKTQPKDRGK